MSQANASIHSAPPPHLLDEVRARLRTLHYNSLRTEEAYVDWIQRFILFHGKRHPNDLGRRSWGRCSPDWLRSATFWRAHGIGRQPSRMQTENGLK